jgi:ribosomal protein S18 acetylase RimI-like enzyme
VNVEQIQNPSKNAFESIFKFILSCDIEEFGEEDSSREDLEEQWRQLDPQKEAWVAVDMEEKIVAYACLSGHETRHTLDLYIHQTQTPRGLEDELAAKCLHRAKELLEGSYKEETTVVGFSTSGNYRLQKALKNCGFEPHTFHFRMQKDIHLPIEKEQWPEEYFLSSYTEEDERELYLLIIEAFEWKGHTKPPIESWRSAIFRGGRYDPHYFVLVRYGKRLVGAALAYAEEKGGWIRQIAVVKDFQGKGLGGRLLRHMFWKFSQAGLSSAALGVASVNSNACQFYERNGMQKVREFIEYRKIIKK